MAFIAMAYTWAYSVGERLEKNSKTEVKKHGRKAKSLFRRGLDHLRRLIRNKLFFDLLLKEIQKLQRTRWMRGVYGKTNPQENQDSLASTQASLAAT